MKLDITGHPVAVLVTGSRDYGESEESVNLLNHKLDSVKSRATKMILLNGGASGADELSNQWAMRNRIQRAVFRADWAMYGKAAGPIRNREMLEALAIYQKQGYIPIVFAFKNKDISKGTDNMVEQAQKAFYPTYIYMSKFSDQSSQQLEFDV